MPLSVSSVFQSPFNGNEYAGFQQYALADVHTVAKVRPSGVTIPSS